MSRKVEKWTKPSSKLYFDSNRFQKCGLWTVVFIRELLNRQFSLKTLCRPQCNARQNGGFVDHETQSFASAFEGRRMDRDFLMELWNLAGNYWSSVDLKNVLFFGSQKRHWTLDVSHSSQPTSENTRKVFIYTSYQNSVAVDDPVSS